MKALVGRELKVAALKKLKVRYIETYYSPYDSHMNYNHICIMDSVDTEESNQGYYIGNSDIDPDNFEDDDIIEGEFDEGTYGVYPVKGVSYK